MKRTAVAAMAVTSAAALALAGCSSSSKGKSGSSSSGGAGASSASSAPAGGGGGTNGKHYNMTFVQGVAGDGFYVTMGCGIKAQAKKIGNISVNIQGPTQFDATLQNPIIASVT